jgi:alkanesulfonate monooxygenase
MTGCHGASVSPPSGRTYTTCPQSKDVASADYDRRVADVARWSENAGAHGILIYTDNGIVDPWLVAQRVIQSTKRLRPLVAVQPVYMHPYSVAKMITSLAYLHGRAIDLNMLAGGFRNDLLALGDETEHDLRYERTVEYTKIVSALLAGETVTLTGRWHRVKRLRLTPRLPDELAPGLLISGSSPAGMAAAHVIGGLAVRYPKPVNEEVADIASRPSGGVGVRVGVIARDTDEEAWRVARERFPQDRRGELRHQLAMKVSDSQWHRQLSELEDGGEEAASPYWLGPFNQGQTFCPYLVGSHNTVGAEIARYMAAGFETFILDIPPDEEELHHTGMAFAAAEC